MEVDPTSFVASEADREDAAAREQDRRRNQLNGMVAIAVALIATFMAICNIKDGNVVQSMQQAQAKSIDYWAWYQAKKTRYDGANRELTLLRLQSLSQPAAVRSAYSKEIAVIETQMEKDKKELQERQDLAKEQDELYDRYNFHDDQFDLAEALLSLSVSLLAITSLTQKRWLFGVAMVPTFFGVLMGLSGLAGWALHPNALIKPLT